MPINNIKGYIQDSLGNLIFLEYLVLNWSRIQGTIPESLGNLTRLRVISLALNHLIADV